MKMTLHETWHYENDTGTDKLSYLGVIIVVGTARKGNKNGIGKYFMKTF